MKNFAVLSVTIIALGSAQCAQATPVIDQQFTGPMWGEASVQPLASGFSYGQTFTAGISGQLVGADLALVAVLPGMTPNDVLVEVTTTVGGFPTSNVLGSGVIAGASIPVTGSTVQFTHVNFSPDIMIFAGQQLALLFFGEGSLEHDPNILIGNSLHAGQQGVIYASGQWVPDGQYFPIQGDFGFRTYVPEPSSVALLGIGLGVLTRFRRKFLSQRCSGAPCSADTFNGQC